MVVLFHSHDHSAFWAALLAAEGLARSGRFPAVLAVCSNPPTTGRPSPNGIRIVRLCDLDEAYDAVGLAISEGCTDVLIATHVVDADHDLVYLTDLTVRTGGHQPKEISRPLRNWSLLGDGGQHPARAGARSKGPVLTARMPTLDRLSEAALLVGRPDKALRRRGYLLAASVLAATAEAGSLDLGASTGSFGGSLPGTGKTDASAGLQAIAHRLQRRGRAPDGEGRAAGTTRGRACGRVRPRALPTSSCRTRLGAPVPDPFAPPGFARRT